MHITLAKNHTGFWLREIIQKCKNILIFEKRTLVNEPYGFQRHPLTVIENQSKTRIKMTKGYLESVKAQFKHYKTIGEKTFDQLNDEDLFWQYNEESNSVAMVVKHIWGNMMSRWSDFLTTDGEKEWRKRDEEFEADIKTKEELLDKWNQGWECLFSALDSITEEDLNSKTIYIRNEGHSITEAINRQLAHYPYHIGQIVFIGKMASSNWRALTIPKGNSKVYNNEMFSKPKK